MKLEVNCDLARGKASFQPINGLLGKLWAFVEIQQGLRMKVR
ncbi:MAG: hypothetical protein ACI957_002696 [Verrucomicrobiales bacterium]|jgi:hypothetical protein